MSDITSDPHWDFIPKANIQSFKPIRERLNCPWDYTKSQNQNIENVRKKIREDLISRGYDSKKINF